MHKLVQKCILYYLTLKFNIMVDHIMQNSIQTVFMKYAHLIYDISFKGSMFSSVACGNIKGWKIVPWSIVILSQMKYLITEMTSYKFCRKIGLKLVRIRNEKKTAGIQSDHWLRILPESLDLC